MTWTICDAEPSKDRAGVDYLHELHETQEKKRGISKKVSFLQEAVRRPVQGPAWWLGRPRRGSVPSGNENAPGQRAAAASRQLAAPHIWQLPPTNGYGIALDDPTAGQIVMLRYFAGLTVDEAVFMFFLRAARQS
jgi:hypothetical protein